MIQLFRKFLGSTIGVGLALGFLVLIMLAFAGGDVAGMMNFGRNSPGGDVAKVGRQGISSLQLSQAATNALENAKRQDPRASMKAFIASGSLDRVVDEMIDRVAIGLFGKDNGLVASPRLIDSEIAKIPAFKGPDGKFSDSAYKQLLRQQGLTDQALRDDLTQSLVARQLLLPAELGATAPRDLVLRYAALLRENRTGAIGLLPSAAFAPKAPPADAELQAFYARNRDRFIRPERRTIRYASFGEAALKSVPPPTDAEIAARYDANKAQYAASETRRLTQLIVPTEPAARAILDEVAKGKVLEAAASAKGLEAARIGPLDSKALAGQSSQAVADAAFAAASGKIAALQRSGLGWHIVRVDGIEKRPGRTLDQARGELTAQLATIKRRAALNDLTARMEDEFDNGGNLADAAKELGLTLAQTPPLTADGQVYLQAGKTAPPVLARVIQTAFAMEGEGKPQLAEVEPGKTFVIFDVSQIAASATPPLAEIKGDVTAAWGMDKGSLAAKAAADKVLDQVRKGTDLGAAFASLGLPLPPVDRVAMGRQQMVAQFKQAIPPPLQLLFSMAKGTVKPLAAPNDRGWYVIALKTIVPGPVDPRDPGLAGAQRELGQVAGQEYSAELARAIRAEVGASRNEAAIKAVRTQLSGGS